jgi:alkylhydroperoxidase family enzyme
MSEADLVRLRAVGLSDVEIWDVAEIAAMYNFTNRMALATGQQPNEEYHHLDRG